MLWKSLLIVPSMRSRSQFVTKLEACKSKSDGNLRQEKMREFQESFTGKFYGKVLRESFTESFTGKFYGKVLQKVLRESFTESFTGKFYGKVLRGNGEQGLD